ncbi:MAG: hypothetical protein AB7O67_08935 [Vicinamibacterales bacterium]
MRKATTSSFVGALLALVLAAGPGAARLVAAARDLPGALEPLALPVRPEYERALKRLYLSVPDEFGVAATPEQRAIYLTFIQHAYSELIEALPAYTRIDIAVSAAQGAGELARLKAVAGDRPLVLHTLDDVKGGLDMWAQDLGERIVVDGQDRFLVPMAVESGDEYNRELSRSRAEVARDVFGDMIVQADFVFEGGNLAFDRVGNRLRVFIGYNDVWLTIENYARLGRTLSVDDVTRIVSSDFGGAEVVVVGKEQQSPRLFHLDQAFILLGDGTAVVNRIVDGSSRERTQLEATRRQLEGLGYRTLVIDHRQEHVARYQMSTNAVPFVDQQTGEKRIIFPVFPGEVKAGSVGVEQLGEKDLQGKGLAAYRTYAAAGYQPVPIRDYAHVVGGNTHCITNVLD